MKIDETVIIKRLGNGYIVTPLYVDGGLVSQMEFVVFQAKGSACRVDDVGGQETLLEWIQQHFSSASAVKSEP